MEIKVTIATDSDSDNSYPPDVVFTHYLTTETVFITLQGPYREIVIQKADLVKFLEIIK